MNVLNLHKTVNKRGKVQTPYPVSLSSDRRCRYKTRTNTGTKLLTASHE